MFVITSFNMFNSTCRRRRGAALQMWFVTDFYWPNAADRLFRCAGREGPCQSASLFGSSRQRRLPASARRPPFRGRRRLSSVTVALHAGRAAASPSEPRGLGQPAHGVGERRRQPRPRQPGGVREGCCVSEPPCKSGLRSPNADLFYHFLISNRYHLLFPCKYIVDGRETVEVFEQARNDSCNQLNVAA